MEVIKLSYNENEYLLKTKRFYALNSQPFYISIDLAGEIRMGPFYVNAKIYKGESLLWDGKKNIYGEESLRSNVISENHNKAILIKWYSTIDPNEQAIVQIDLTNGIETVLGKKARYWDAGHFYSFDGMFCKKHGVDDYLCTDFETNRSFLMLELLKEKIPNPYKWSISSIKNCIIVFAKESKNNLILFDIKRKVIVDRTSFKPNLSSNGGFSSVLDKLNNCLYIRTYDYDISGENRIINNRYDYYKIKLKNSC